MDAAEYLRHIDADGKRLSQIARTAPTATVPSCPEWDMTALVGHASGVHHWVTGILESRATERPKRPRPTNPDDFDEVIVWFDEGHAALVAALSSMEADELVWNWFDNKPAPAQFWRRRMAHETTVHRWDAERAAGAEHTTPIDTELAVDGIDEWLSFITVDMSGRAPGLHGSLQLVATDTDCTRTLALSADRIEVSSSIDAEATVRAPASQLFLWFLNRVATDDVDWSGDRSVLGDWSAVKF